MRGKSILRAALVAALFVLLLGVFGPAQGSVNSASVEPQFWARIAPAGFGDAGSSSVASMAVYNNRLYAGTINRTVGGSVWRYNGSKWEVVAAPGTVSTLANPSITGMIVFKNKLYIGTAWSALGPANMRYQVWRYDGSTWENVLEEGYPVHGFTTFAIYNDGSGDALYVGVSTNLNDQNVPVAGARVMRSTSGDKNSWTTSVTNGNGNSNAFGITGMKAFNGSLYVAVADLVNGAQVWKLTGTTWSTVVSDGFSVGASNWDPGGFTVVGTHLYLGVRNQHPTSGVSTGGKLYRTQDGSTWAAVTSNGFGNLENVKVEGVVEHDGRLYALVTNYVKGMQLWTSTDGTNWKLFKANGFGNSNNSNSIWTSAQAVYNGRLYIGTSDHSYSRGAEVWTHVDNGVFLPAINR